jgi:hypothetical protein
MKESTSDDYKIIYAALCFMGEDTYSLLSQDILEIDS